MDYKKNSDVLKAIGHPVRLRMVEGIFSYKCNVGKMVEKLGLPQSTVSQHLAVLRNNGIIAPKKQGVKTCYEVVDPRIKSILKILRT